MRIDRVKLITKLAERDMSGKRLSEISGLSRSTISFVINGKSCSDEVGRKIANALGADVADLIS